jgi:heme/copper-type cytochrome/quinol oxidase subunit 2
MPRKGSHGGGGGSGSGSMLTKLFVGLILIFVGLYFVATFAPILGNLTGTVGGTVGVFLDIAVWVIPLLAIVGLIIYGVKHFTGSGR